MKLQKFAVTLCLGNQRLEIIKREQMRQLFHYILCCDTDLV